MNTEAIEALVTKLEFGCPFKAGSIGEKDAEAFETIAQEAAQVIRDLLAECDRLTAKAAAHLADQDYMVAMERKMVAGEIADYLKEIGMTFFPGQIRAKYGVEE